MIKTEFSASYVAAHLDISAQRVGQLRKDGVLATAANGKFDLDACRIAYIRWLRNDARARFRDAQVGIEAASRAMAAAEKPTRAVEAVYRRAQAAVSGASKASEEQKAAVIGAKRALDTGGIPISRIAGEQRRLATHVERTTRALHQQKQVVERSPAEPVARRAAALLQPTGRDRFIESNPMTGGQFRSIGPNPGEVRASAGQPFSLRHCTTSAS